MTAEEVLAKIARPVEPWPSKDAPMFYLRAISAQAKFEMRDYSKLHPEVKYYQLMFVNGVVDEQGNRILANDDAAKVADGQSDTIEDVVVRINELCGSKENPDPKASSGTAPN